MSSIDNAVLVVYFLKCAGTIPKELGKPPKLSSLYLDDNRLTGKFERHISIVWLPFSYYNAACGR